MFPRSVSTITVVDFTTATATDPGSSPRSRTASLLISDTTRKGPHWSSTCAMTSSVLISVTSPTNRFRAEVAMSPGTSREAACLRATIATS